MVSKEEFQGWILDYACYHRIFPIIHAVRLHHSGCLEDLPLPHLRLACATIDFIIESEQLSQFDIAIQLVQQVNQAVPRAVVCQKTYLRLLTGLKIKALFEQLQDDPNRALVKLNTYFPRTTTKSTNRNKGQTLSKFNQNHKNFRCFFFSLVSNDNQLRAYLREDYGAEFGPKFMQSIKKLCGRFLQQIESQLLPPIIEKVLACTECEKFSQISPATEMLLDFVQEKKLFAQSGTTDKEQNPAQQSGQRASYVFTQRELFEMLTVSCPVYTQDWLACDHRLNLSRYPGQDLFDTTDSQESLSPQNSRMKSPSAIVSNSQEIHSGLLMLSAEAPEPVDSFLVLQEKTPSEAHPVTGVKCAEQRSPIVAGKVRRSRSTPGECPPGTAKLRGEDQPSPMETEAAIPQCERFEDEMEHAQSPLNLVNRPTRIQDEVRLPHMDLEEFRLFQMAAQSEVPPGQETTEKNILPHSEISERTLGRSSRNRNRSSDQQLQKNKSSEQKESSPQIPDIVEPINLSKVTHVSSPLPEKNDPQPNITSTPISCQPATSHGLQEDNGSPRQTPSTLLFTSPDLLSSQESILTQPKYIQPWPAYKPRRPSYKLLRSKIIRTCDVYDGQHQETEIELTRKEPEPLTAVTSLLETNSPEPSLRLREEDLAPSSCPQSDKGSDPLPSSWVTSSSPCHSTDLSSSLSSGSCDIVSPSDSNSAEEFFMATPDDTVDTHYNFINRHLIQGIKACIIKLHRNQELDVVEEEQVYSIYI